MIFSSANRYLDVYRRSAFVLDAATAAAAMTLDREIRAECFLQVEIAGGTDGTGSVTITGTAPDDSAQVESLTFTGNGAQQTTGRWKAGTTPTIATAGLHDESSPPTVAISTVGADGGAQLQRTAVATGRPALFRQRGGANWRAAKSGTHESGSFDVLIGYEEVWTPRVGDIVIEPVSGDEWLIQSVQETRIGFGVSAAHWTLSLTRRDT